MLTVNKYKSYFVCKLIIFIFFTDLRNQELKCYGLITVKIPIRYLVYFQNF